ncbi:hypothetical protein MANES_18G073729v8 [Manihot esculenta]|uniref:Uncharacterized protein n=1 Tax=Manihot esculenta TaxID=3983 RepID=A0ACB7FZ02_MANES|nr:hypothetical protein MANES_18G073729v8 [Manihot esculenta]
MALMSRLQRSYLETTKGSSLFRSVAALDSGGGGSTCTLALSGKSSAKKELAQSLTKNIAIKIPDNTEVSILLESEIAKLDKEDPFNVELFFNSLSTSGFDRFLFWSLRLTSTHDVLPIGTACVADFQYKGRGWKLSVVLFTAQMEDGRVVPLLQHVVSLAVTEATKDLCHRKALQFLDVKRKWPNDLYLNDLKVDGVLCTSTYKSKKFIVSAGLSVSN